MVHIILRLDKWHFSRTHEGSIHQEAWGLAIPNGTTADKMLICVSTIMSGVTYYPSLISSSVFVEIRGIRGKSEG